MNQLDSHHIIELDKSVKSGEFYPKFHFICKVEKKQLFNFSGATI